MNVIRTNLSLHITHHDTINIDNVCIMYIIIVRMIIEYMYIFMYVKAK